MVVGTVAYDIMPKSLFIVNTFNYCFRKQFLASSALLGNFLEKIVLCDEDAALGSGQAVGYAAMCDILFKGDGMMFNSKVSTLHCTNTDLSGETSKSLKFLTILSLGNCKFLGTVNIHQKL